VLDELELLELDEPELLELDELELEEESDDDPVLLFLPLSSVKASPPGNTTT